MNKTSMMILVAMAAGMTACSDNATAPEARSSAVSTPVNGGGATQALVPGDTVRFSITINPQQDTYYYLGAGNSLVFPAGSLCDPWKSTYGPGQWDAPCTPAYWPLTVNVTAWVDAAGHARVDFDKHIRFVPTTNPAKMVVITFADLQASLDPFFNILYCPTSSSACVDEALTDPSLLTVRNPVTGKVTRRIKHFSGYNVAAGLVAGDEGGVTLSISPDDSDMDYESMSMSLSRDDLSFTSVPEVLNAYSQMNVRQAERMLTIIRTQKKSGYILASG